MKQFISICKNVIASNNKRNWVDPLPSIRVSNSKSGKVVNRSNHLGIVDKDGVIVARIQGTTDGKPVISCGAKVGLFTEYETVEIQDEH